MFETLLTFLASTVLSDQNNYMIFLTMNIFHKISKLYYRFYYTTIIRLLFPLWLLDFVSGILTAVTL